MRRQHFPVKRRFPSCFKFFRYVVAYISMTVYVTVFMWCVQEEEKKLKEIQVWDYVRWKCVGRWLWGNVLKLKWEFMLRGLCGICLVCDECYHHIMWLNSCDFIAYWCGSEQKKKPQSIIWHSTTAITLKHTFIQSLLYSSSSALSLLLFLLLIFNCVTHKPSECWRGGRRIFWSFNSKRGKQEDNQWRHRWLTPAGLSSDEIMMAHKTKHHVET